MATLSTIDFDYSCDKARNISGKNFYAK